MTDYKYQREPRNEAELQAVGTYRRRFIENHGREGVENAWRQVRDLVADTLDLIGYTLCATKARSWDPKTHTTKPGSYDIPVAYAAYHDAGNALNAVRWALWRITDPENSSLTGGLLHIDEAAFWARNACEAFERHGHMKRKPDAVYPDAFPDTFRQAVP